MIADFEIHAASGRMVIRREQPDGVWARIYDLTSGVAIGEIDRWYVPQGLRFSPDGSHLAFFGDGSLYVYDIDHRRVDCVFHEPTLHASFCAWSPTGTALVFSAYHTYSDKRRPPDIYTIVLPSRQVVQLTDTENVELCNSPH